MEDIMLGPKGIEFPKRLMEVEVNSSAPTVRIGLPVIGARSTLADVLRLFGHEPVENAAALDHHFTNRRVHRGQSLLVSGQPFENLYLTLSGSFKATLNEADGTQQIVAFPLRGDLIGLDAIQCGRYPVTVTALEEANVAVIPHRELVEFSLTCPMLEQAFMEAVSAELLRNYQAMRAMGALGAEARLARFLHDLGQRMARFGFSPRAFRLTMTRADIASYLGLSIETVSRAFTSLAARGLVEVNRRNICILNRERLSHAEEFAPHSLQVQVHEHTQSRGQKPAVAVEGNRLELGLVN
jgi:CRP/FNR family transcriptional regulator, anaerobic regulatory protein